jgi:CheY-like chemotaxis protein
MILVIEDDAAVRALAVRMLRSLGYKAFEVSDGIGAETLLANGVKPDLVLSDVVLPGGTSGPQFAEAAPARDPDIRIVFMLGYSDEVARQNGFIGSDSVLLNKPFQRRQLAQAVHDALG